RGAHVLELAPQLGHPLLDAPAVGLQLRLTRTAATDTAALAADTSTGLPGEVATPATQSLVQVLQLGQLDLRLALPALRVLGEDVEDQRGAVDDLDLEAVLQVAQLRGAQLTVEDDGVGPGGVDHRTQLTDLARADVRRRVRLLTALQQAVENLRARRLGEQLQLGQRTLGVHRRPLGPHAGEHDALEAQLPVLDLADVGQLGRHARDPAQRDPVLQVEHARRGLVELVRRLRLLGGGVEMIVESVRHYP